jgi:anti-anti-sigma regulatory factor
MARMARPERPTVPAEVDSDAIRRRVEREYIVMSAPVVLDAPTAARLVDVLRESAGDADIVVDLRDVMRCEPAAVDVLASATQDLRRAGASLTLSHPSPPFEQALARQADRDSLVVRRPRTRRPARRSSC